MGRQKTTLPNIHQLKKAQAPISDSGPCENASRAPRERLTNRNTQGNGWPRSWGNGRWKPGKRWKTGVCTCRGSV